MTGPEFYIIPAAILSGVLATISKYKNYKTLHYITKPLTICLMIFYGAFYYRDSYIQGKKWVMAGLILSLAGDVFLMLHEKYFKAGLFAFLIAHICYTLYFIDGLLISRLFNLYSILLYVPGAAVIAMFIDKLGKYKIPVLIYTFVIINMAAFSIPYYLSTGDYRVVIAAFLFIISDFTLAYNKFIKNIKYAHLVILPTYFVSQFLFVLSIIV